MALCLQVIAVLSRVPIAGYALPFWNDIAKVVVFQELWLQGYVFHCMTVLIIVRDGAYKVASMKIT